MIIFARSVFWLPLCLCLLCAGMARAEDSFWLSFDQLGAGDRALGGKRADRHVRR